MRLIKALFLAGALLAGNTAFAADQQLMNLVMPDARILGGVNVTTAKISPFGQFVLSRIPASDKGLQELIATTGFDPRQDAAELLVATAADPASPGGLLLVRGNFKVSQIAATAGKNSHIEVSSYAGATLITATNPKAKAVHAVAFIGDSIAVAGEAGDVKAALDRSHGVNSIDPALATQVNALSAGEDAWVVSSVAVGSLAPSGKAPAPTGPAAALLPVLKNIQAFSGGVKLGSDVQLTVQAKAGDANNAAALGAVVRLVVSLASANAGTNPQLAQVAGLLGGLQVATSGQTVNLALTVGEAQLEALVNSLPQRAASPAAARPAPQRARRNRN